MPSMDNYTPQLLMFLVQITTGLLDNTRYDTIQSNITTFCFVLFVNEDNYFYEIQFCFGNSDPTSGYDEFLGTVAVQDLINEPALFEVSSSVGKTLTVNDITFYNIKLL